MKHIALIMAGGNGTRFWPMSRKSSPKQFLKLNNNDTLLNETINRIKKQIPYEDIYIISNQNHCIQLEKSLPHEFIKTNILYEPIAKNTAPAIVTAAHYLKLKYDNAVMMVLPSDNHIINLDSYLLTMKQALIAAENDPILITLGIEPTYPATGYGYIKTLPEDNQNIFKVESFVEKPNEETAKFYIESGSFYWNSGMFIWQIDVLFNAIKKHMPTLYQNVQKIKDWHQQFSSGELLKIYEQLESTSIDYGLMEKAESVCMLPLESGWNDLGSWDALESVREKDQSDNITEGKTLLIDSNNNIVISHKKLITTVDISDLVIVETEDAIMICPKSKSQNVRKIVEVLKTKKMNTYL